MEYLLNITNGIVIKRIANSENKKSVQALIPLLEAEIIAKKENKLIRIETYDTHGILMDAKWESLTYEFNISDPTIID